LQPNRNNGFAIAALVLGIAACCVGLIPILGFFAFPLATIGLVLGIIGIASANKRGRSGTTMAIIGTVLCVLGVVLAIIGVLILNTAFGHRDSSPGQPGQIAAAPTQKIRADDLDVQFGKFVADGNPSLESGKLPVTLTNKGNVTASFKVHLEALDAAGKRIDDDTAYAPNLAPGQSTTTYMFVLIESSKLNDLKRATFRIVEASKY
jgi:cytochrome c biogenesis factor